MIGAMTYDQLVAFLAVAGEGTFTAASAALHKSQPAVSKLVRNLEDELGVQLFDREQYRATLTDAGRLFHERAASVIESSEALKTFGKQLALFLRDWRHPSLQAKKFERPGSRRA